MKKVLALLILCLSGTLMFAQKAGPDTYWHVEVNDQANMSMYTVLFINNVELFEVVDNYAYEVGVFDQDGVCHCAKYAKKKKIDGVYHYEFILTIQGHEPAEGEEPLVFTFRIYDHPNNQELDVTFSGEPITFATNAMIGTGNEPYALHFTNGAVAGIDKNITGYSPEDHWYFLSSPVGSFEDASQVANLTDGTYDLYYFDQTGGDDGKEWRNYKTNAFGFEAGKGYLYANESDVIVTFYGTPYEGDGIFELAYEEEVQDSDMRGWNLMGNPYNESATVSMEQFYVMEGAAMVPNDGNNVVGPMEGIFVKASGEGETVVFTPGEGGGKVSKLSLNLVGNSGLVDRAVVNFGEGSLPKFQINSSSAKLYIPMDGEEYAVVSSEEMGEIPVSFKAERSGSYSLVVSTEMSFNYLHLIDNLTGADVDLLATPSYGFEAVTTDYASRFKLVFATGSSDDTFAFYSNGSFVISNEGEATVQVVDVTGRMLSSETINGSASVSVSGAAGVYMIRLINGDNVKVQKVVVK